MSPNDQQNTGKPDAEGGESAEGKKKEKRAGVDKALRKSLDRTRALLNEEIEILPDKRAPHLDQGPIMAYLARQKDDAAHFGFFALVCENHLIPRTRQAGAIAAVNSPSFARLVASGVCYWPPAMGERYVFVYENNLGQPILKPGQGGLSWRPDLVMQAIINPMTQILQDLRDADVYHGSIRASNMYDGGAKVIERVILGDCLALPPSFAQPVLYEPIERAMADPVARGRGAFEDDLYALGVTLAVALRHKDPMEGAPDDEIIKTKLEQGSYTALMGKERFTGAILELLRGLLYDDQSQRWTLVEVMSWLDGQRLSPKQSARKVKAARPIGFHNEKYFRPAILAMDLAKNQAEAVQMVESDTLGLWIERSLEDKMASGRLEKAIAASEDSGRGPGYWDKLLSRVSMALDPGAPIRYKNLNINVEGMSAAMADAVIRKKDVQPYLDIINSQLMVFWLDVQTDLKVDMGTVVSRFDSCRAFLRQQSLGYGIERCLYFLATEAPCISEVLKGYYVRNPEDLMFAFEDIAGKPNRPHLFIDRHIAAFLSVKDRQVIDQFLVELNAPEFHRRILANIKVLSTLQKRSRLNNMPGISAWAAAILQPVYERFHDRELRANVKKKIDKMANEGDLVRMVALLDDHQARQQDFNLFRQAMQEYGELQKELSELEGSLKDPQNYGRDIGHEYAAVASAVISGMIILTVIVLYFSHTGLF